MQGGQQGKPWRQWVFLRWRLFFWRVRAPSAGDVPGCVRPVWQGYAGTIPAQRRQARLLLGLLRRPESLWRRVFERSWRRWSRSVLNDPTSVFRRDAQSGGGHFATPSSFSEPMLRARAGLVLKGLLLRRWLRSTAHSVAGGQHNPFKWFPIRRGMSR